MKIAMIMMLRMTIITNTRTTAAVPIITGWLIAAVSVPLASMDTRRINITRRHNVLLIYL